MPRESTRARERAYFEQFRRDFNLPFGEVEYGDAPDVLIRGELVVGIELANLYLTDGKETTSLQQQRRLRERVIEAAHALYVAAGGAAFEFTIEFDPAVPITDVGRVAGELAQLAVVAQSGPGGELLRSFHAATPELRFLYRTPDVYEDAKWRGIQGFTVPFVDAGRVQTMVDAKLEKLPTYRPCDAQWLLLIVDLMDSAQDVELQWPAGVRLRRGGFGRVLIYKPQCAEWIEPPSDQ